MGGWVLLRGPWKAVRAGEGFAPSNERLCLLHERRGRVADRNTNTNTCCYTAPARCRWGRGGLHSTFIQP